MTSRTFNVEYAPAYIESVANERSPAYDATTGQNLGPVSALRWSDILVLFIELAKEVFGASGSCGDECARLVSRSMNANYQNER